jgi:hypothetical protein
LNHFTFPLAMQQPPNKSDLPQQHRYGSRN